MDIYFGGIDRPSFVDDLLAAGATHIIVSYGDDPYPKLWERIRQSGLKVMVDSGAFQMWQRGIEIDIDAYMQYIDNHQPEEYVVLDDPENQETTIANLLYMEEKGYKPMPVFSYGAEWHYLDWLASRYNRIGLGGCVPRSPKEIIAWMTEVFRRYPDKQYHLFGITRKEILSRFPLASADSTTWTTRWGKGNKTWCSNNRRAEQQFRVRRFMEIGKHGGWIAQNLFEEEIV